MEQRFIEDELIILTKQTMDSFLNSDFKPKGDLIQLYIFYYYTSKWQKTNQVKCTTSYVAQGLEISEARVRAAKKELTNLGLIEDVKTYDDKNRISGHYVLLRYKFKNGAEKAIHPPFQNQQCGEDFHPHEKQQGGKNNSVENQRTNAYSTNNINAYSTNNLNAYSDYCPPDGELCANGYSFERENEMKKESREDVIDRKCPTTIYSDVINYLNGKTGSQYKGTTNDTQKHIKARVNEGFTFDDFKTVIDKKCAEWLNTDMAKYLRPATLFGTKFESYLNAPSKGADKWYHETSAEYYEDTLPY